MSDSNGLRIGQLARYLGTTTKTLRYYEQIGLLGPVRRTDSGYRVYGEHARALAERVLALRALNLSLLEIQALLRPDDDGRSLRQRLMAVLDEKLRDMEVDLSVLQGRYDDLAARHQALLMVPRGRPDDCICDALSCRCTCCRKP